MTGAQVVAEAVERRLEHAEGGDVRLLLRGVGAPRAERHGIGLDAQRGLGGRLDGGAAGEHDEVGRRHADVALQRLELRDDSGRAGIDRPVLLRRQAQARAVGAAALVCAAEGGCGRPRRADELRDAEVRCEHLRLKHVHVSGGEWRDGAVRRGHGVLPQLRWRHERPEAAADGAHVAVRELVPRAREGVGELLRVLVEALRDRGVGTVDR